MNWTPPLGPGRGAHARRILVATAVLALLVLSPVGGTITASGQATPPAPAPDPAADPAAPAPEPPAPDPSPHLRVLLAQLGIYSAQDALVVQQQAQATAHAAQAQADVAVAAAVLAQSTADADLAAARQLLGTTAAYAFMHAGGGDFVAVIQGDATAGGRERELYSASVDHHKKQLAEAEQAKADADAAVDAAQATLDGATRAAADQDIQVVASAVAIDDARHEQATAQADEHLPITDRSWQLTIEGPSTFTPDELAEWYQAGGHGSQASVPIADLIRSFIEQGTAEGVRGDMAFAQSIHETGWFANNDTIGANNFAGIGHCSDCGGGFPFKTAEVGALAQIQLLKSYAEEDPTYNLPRAAKKVNGPAGCCPTWLALGGVWASDTNYGPHILDRYAEMLEWLVLKRTAGR